MMRRRNNNNNQGSGGGQRRHNNNGGQRRYNNNGQGGGGNRGDNQNLARQKHHATQMREKFMNHARDAQNNGDRVDVEYYLQHVEHYNRVLADITAIENERQAQQQQQHQSQQGQQDHNSEGEGDQGGEAPQAQQQSQSQADHAEEPISNSNQPRMTRGPRRQHTPQNDPNGAKAANANNEEIPLPGGVIGAI